MMSNATALAPGRHAEGPAQADVAIPGTIVQLRGAIDAELARALPELPGHEDVFGHALATGHRTRPIACLLSCAAAGGAWRDALGAAVGVELIHKASVARDDIVDGDDRRSGQKALHARFGVPTALAASDVMWTAGVGHVARTARPQQHQLLTACMHTLGEMASGQLEDVAPSATHRTAAARLLVDENKTGALTELACRLGAIVAGGSQTTADALADYGRKVGTAFQVLNDVRNVQGRESGRPVASDIHAGRETVVTALARSSAGATPSQPAQGGAFDDAPSSLHAHVLASGSVARSEGLATALLADARDALNALPDTPAREVLLGLARRELFEIYAF